MANTTNYTLDRCFKEDVAQYLYESEFIYEVKDIESFIEGLR